MMRLLKLLPLLLPALFLGATCVTRVDQQGPTGPWTGEVINTGPDAARDQVIMGSVLDANNKNVQIYYAEVCPYVLPLGKKGYFHSPHPDWFGLSPGAVEPFHLSELSVRHSPMPVSSAPAVTDVSFQVAAVDSEHKAILVQMTNNSRNTYGPLHVCVVNFSPSGEFREIGEGGPFTGSIFKPGDVEEFAVHFDSPLDGTFEFSADPRASTPADVFLKSPPFTYTSRIIETYTGRQLEVVGEVTNTSNKNLHGVSFEAYLENSPTVRITGQIGEYTDVLPAGKKGFVTFLLPLAEGDGDVVGITGIGGSIVSPPPLSIPVQNISIKASLVDAEISVTISNPTSKDLIVDTILLEARDATGKLLGGKYMLSSPYVQHQGSANLLDHLTLIGTRKAVSFDVVAYGHYVAPPSTNPPAQPTIPPLS